jgi:hypothetical protein
MGTPVCRFSRFMSGTGSLKVGCQLLTDAARSGQSLTATTPNAITAVE